MNVPTKKNNTWIWYFVILFVLAIAASASMVIYNLWQQLRPEQFEVAQALWNEKGPRDYDFTYVADFSSRNNPQRTIETYAVRVRAGQVVEVTRDGQPLEERLYWNHSMPAKFAEIKRF